MKLITRSDLPEQFVAARRDGYSRSYLESYERRAERKFLDAKVITSGSLIMLNGLMILFAPLGEEGLRGITVWISGISLFALNAGAYLIFKSRKRKWIDRVKRDPVDQAWIVMSRVDHLGGRLNNQITHWNLYTEGLALDTVSKIADEAMLRQTLEHIRTVIIRLFRIAWWNIRVAETLEGQDTGRVGFLGDILRDLEEITDQLRACLEGSHLAAALELQTTLVQIEKMLTTITPSATALPSPTS